ncbi:MAG: glycosyltransferase family 39 protein, partial [Roseiflexaceae bacterium]|nr:glycosyltransferase family 39 protein [Roseiflexaceae bacterium]
MSKWMRQNLTTRVDAPIEPANHMATLANRVARTAVVALFGALLIGLAYQLPSAHQVDIGRMDAAYVQGFHEAERADARAPAALLAGSDGAARWSTAQSFIVFPQIGLPATLDLRLRGPATSVPGSELIVLLNGSELGRMALTNSWADAHFVIERGLLKPSDVVIELRAVAPAPISADDARVVGALLDRASLRTSAWPIVPYPGQMVLGGLAAGLLSLVLARPDPARPDPALKRRAIGMVGAAGMVALGFLLLYRLQLPYSYPLRGLLVGLNIGLAGLLALRYGPRMALRVPALLDLAALGGVGLWLAALLRAAQQHVTLSRPGVETDFSVFARRSAQLHGLFQASGNYDAASDGVLRADGFYQLGYPLLLWLLRPFNNDNPFLAARPIAAISGALVLLATWWLARQLFGRGAALIALLCLACSPLMASYGMFAGTDAPLAAACAVALALLFGLRARMPSSHWQAVAALLLAGAAAGTAFLFRHPGLLLL